jgi:hypothetical protein
VEWIVVGWSLNETQWSVNKCSEVEWSVVGWRLNETKWSVNKCSEVEWSVVGWSLVKCSEGLSNKVSNIIIRYIDHKKFAAYMPFSFITFFHFFWFHFLSLYIWLYVLYAFVWFCKLCIFNCYVYVLLLLHLRIFIVTYVPFCIFCFHCVVLRIVCV